MNKIQKLATCSLFALSAGIFTSCQSGTDGTGGKEEDGIKLAFNLKPGTKYLYSIENNQNINMGMEMQQNMLMEYIYDITSAEGHNRKMSVTLDHIKIDGKMMGQNMSYDSKDPNSATNNPLAAAGSSIGKSFSVTVSPGGEIIKVEGFGDLMKEADPQGQGMPQQLNDSTIKKMMGATLDMFPGKPVKIGESWIKNTTMDVQPFSMAMEIKYTLKSVADGKANIDVSTSIKVNPAGQADPRMKDVKIDLSGTQSGTVIVEIESGQLLSGDIKQSITGKINTQGMEVPMTVTGVIKTTSKKL